jgi:hypothetical protein
LFQNYLVVWKPGFTNKKNLSTKFCWYGRRKKMIWRPGLVTGRDRPKIYGKLSFLKKDGSY